MAILNGRAGGRLSRADVAEGNRDVTMQDVITGTPGWDELRGTPGDDVIDGLSGYDQIWGGDGNDILRSGEDGGVLYGEAGDDRLEGGPGSSAMEGGAGNDVIIGGDDVDHVIMGLGSDVVQTGAGKDYIEFRSLRDDEGHQLIDAGSDDDTIIIGSRGKSTFEIATGVGADILIFSSLGGDAAVTLGAGVDRVRFWTDAPAGKITFLDFAAGAGGDRIDWIDLLTTSAYGWDVNTNPFATGYLRLRQEGLYAVLDFDQNGGGDTYRPMFVFAGRSASAFTAENFDGYRPDGAMPAGITFSGTNNSDWLDGTSGNDTIDGLAGDDAIGGGAGNDTIRGGAGSDSLTGEIGDDTLEGGADNDSLSDKFGNDILRGGDGDDTLFAEAGADELDGGDGNDYLSINSRDLLTRTARGGEGDDVIVLMPYTAAHHILDGGAGADRISIDGLSKTANVTLGSGSDILELGTAQSDTTAWQGQITVRDFATGVNGDAFQFLDFVSDVTTWDGSSNPFGSGHLRLRQDGASTLFEIDRDGGGDGYRTLVIFNATQATAFTSVNLSGFAPDGSPPPGLVLTGGEWSDTLHGGSGDDQISGGAEQDLLYGAAGADMLFGETGNDYLYGEAGADTLLGGSGNDGLTGGYGDDLVEGGEDNDWISDPEGSDTLRGGAGDDNISVDRRDSMSASVYVDGGAGNDTIELRSYSYGAVVFDVNGGDGDDLVKIGGMTASTTVTLGAGIDKLSVAFDFATYSGSVRINDFVAGAGGDQIDLSILLERFSPPADPFGSGYARIVKSGSDTLVEFDRDGRGGIWGFQTIFVLAGVNPTTLTVDNLGYTVNALSGTAAADVVVGTERDEVFDLAQGGADQISGGGGGDLIYFGASYGAGDIVNGGAGIDSLSLQGSYGSATPLSLTGSSIQGIEVLVLMSNTDLRFANPGMSTSPSQYTLVMQDNLLATGGTLQIDGRGLTAAETLSVDAAAEATGAYAMFGGASADTLIGGGGQDVLDGGAGDDILNGSGGADTLRGGLGNDLYLSDGLDTIVEAAGGGTDEVRTAAAAYTLTAANIEILTGTSATGQTLNGSEVGNLIDGGAGNDIMNGLGGADTLRGNAGNDVYIVGAGDVVVEAAGNGTDRVRTALASYSLAANVEELVGTAATGQGLSGNALANTITGGSGNDILDGAGGADILQGGLGDDIYVFDGSDALLEAANAGTDEVRVSFAAYTLAAANIENVTGTSSAGQALTGNGVANVITGGTGNDTLDGGAGADTLRGGLGNDIYLVDESDIVVEAASAGTDEVRVSLATYTLRAANVEILTGISATGQTLNGNELGNLIDGGAGNDIMNGLGGSDTLRGNGGNDVYIVGAGDVVVETAGNGTDRVRTALASYSLTADVEELVGTATTGQILLGNYIANTITGGSGNDFLDGGNGSDILQGGLGDDVYFFDGSDGLVEAANAGTDEVRVAAASFTLGANFENVIGTGSANQLLTGNAAANLIDGGLGADRMVGLGGNDIYLVDNLGDVVVEAVGDGVDEVRTALGSRTDFSQLYVLAANVETFTGTSTTGQGVRLNAGDNVVRVLMGNDLLVLDNGGNDQVNAGGGSDFLYMGAAFTNGDALNGGAGNDTVSLTGTYALTLQADDLVMIEKLILDSSGNAAAPYTYALVMNNANVAAGQQMVVAAEALLAGEVLSFNGAGETDGSYSVQGGRGGDTIVTGAGADRIWGNGGADLLTGGAGKDLFDYRAASDSTAAARDRIGDFAAGDQILLQAIDADGAAGNGDSAFRFVGAAAFSHSAGELRASAATGIPNGWLVEGDVNGDGIGDLSILVVATPGYQLSAADFVL
ncbi:calcium-binding protein [Sphingosinicella sp. BN140058]|uniref:calcium-binding protein n=1 Tax=Sphingosinicella sp. BN140058 TaxID=1892855 RepID=UPI0010111B2A|nr:calcium-binding protein [Sphingosinicella sp. BN140058]QAY77742.1 calcium-binding protein [Sphingosinicella sp. BN140058]